jgi:hypothetical protein
MHAGGNISECGNSTAELQTPIGERIHVYYQCLPNKQRQLGKLPSLQTAESQSATSFAEKCDVFYKGLFPEPPEAEPINWNVSRPSMHYQWPKIKRSRVVGNRMQILSVHIFSGDPDF